MNALPQLFHSMQLDLRGCDYAESSFLTHIDGFLVRYNNRGRLILQRNLSDEEKLQGVQRLLSYIEQAPDTAGLFFWTKNEIVRPTVTPQQPYQPPHPSATSLLIGDRPTAPPGLMPPERGFVSLLHLPRAYISTTTSELSRQRALRQIGAAAEHLLIEEATPAGYDTSVALRGLGEPQWTMLVSIDPPVAGQIRLTIGQDSFSAGLGADGTGVLSGIEPALLQAAQGPDLDLWIAAADSSSDGEV